MNLVPHTTFLTELTQKRGPVWIGTDFTTTREDNTWLDTVSDTGTAVVSDAENGVLVLTPSDCTVADNDEAYISSAVELFKFGVNRAIYGVCKFRWTETTANIPNIGFGFMNAAVADSLTDNGGGPKVSGSTLAIYKVDGGAVWRVASSCNGTSTVTVTNAAAVEDTDYIAEIMCNDWDGVSMQVSFKINGSYLCDTNNVIIRHTVLIASATEMDLWAGIKLGAATNNDTMSIDYIYGAQTRV